MNEGRSAELVEPALLSGEMVCPQCQAGTLTRRHCKTLCEQCGYVESCEDNFLPNQANPDDPGKFG